MDIKVKHLTERFEALKQKRQKWEGVWAEIDQFVCPQSLLKGGKQIFDSTPIWCREQLASGLQMLLVNPSYPWFSLEAKTEVKDQASGIRMAHLDPELDDPQLKLWRDGVEKGISSVFSNPFNNFYNQAHVFFLTLVAYGTAVFYVEESQGLPDLMSFRSLPLRECYFEGNQFGQVNTMYRFFHLSAQNAARQWGKDPVFQKMLIENRQDEELKILHVVRENPANKTFPFESLHIDFDNTRLIEEKGYDYFPFLVTRWMVEDADGYGSAPGGHVMPDIKLLNTLRQDHAKIMKKALDPPLLVPEHGYHLPLSITPGSINFYRNGIADPIRPVTPMEDVQISFEEMAQCRDAILKAFYIDIFRMGKESKEMTAAEVQMRSEEQMRLMGAIVGRIESEFLNPLILAVYQILGKYQRLPKWEGNTPSLDIRYISPLARSQKSAAYNSTEAILSFLQRSGLANVYPDIYDNINPDNLIKLFAELKGVPADILNSEEEKNQIRQKRKFEMEQMQQLQGGMR